MPTKAEATAAVDTLALVVADLPSEVVSGTDNFERPNESLEANPNYTRIGGIAGGGLVESNVLKSNTTDLTGTGYQLPGVGSASQYVSGVFQSNGSLSFLCVRMTDPNNWIGFRYYNTVMEVYKKIGGGAMQNIATVTTTRDGSVFRLEYDAVAGTVRVLKGASVIRTPISVGALGALPASNTPGIVLRAAALPFVDNLAWGAL